MPRYRHGYRVRNRRLNRLFRGGIKDASDGVGGAEGDWRSSNTHTVSASPEGRGEGRLVGGWMEQLY